MTEKTHYRKAFNSPYLSSADIVEPTVLTISHVRFETDKTKKTKEFFNTAYFKEKDLRPGEPLKPMVLNAGNSRIMRGFTGSSFLEDWNNVNVTIYVDPHVKFGRDVREGLRLSTEQPKMSKPELLPDTEAWTRAIDAYKRDDNLKTVEKHMEISKENRTKLIEEAKNES